MFNHSKLSKFTVKFDQKISKIFSFVRLILKFFNELDGCRSVGRVDRSIQIIKEAGGHYTSVNIFYNENLLHETALAETRYKKLFLTFHAANKTFHCLEEKTKENVCL